MRVLPLCVLLALSVAAYGQSPGQIQPDTSGQRLHQLLRSADELQQAGRQQEAAAARQQAEWERQALRNHMESLQAEVHHIQRVIGPVQQVAVHLKVIEVSLTKLKSIGFDMSKLPGNSSVAMNDASKPPLAGTYSVLTDTNKVAQIFDTLCKDHHGKVLAEPTVVCISGQNASFNSGGEVPIPTKKSDGSKTVNWQQYGTQMQLLPQVLGNRTVRLAIQLRISELDYSNVTHVDNDAVPGIRSRDLSTCAELPSGQTLMISGLIQTRVEAENHGLPWVGDIPYAGAVFRSVKETRNELATYVLITPELVESSDMPAQATTAVPMQATRPMPVRVRR